MEDGTGESWSCVTEVSADECSLSGTLISQRELFILHKYLPVCFKSRQWIKSQLVEDIHYPSFCLYILLPQSMRSSSRAVCSCTLRADVFIHLSFRHFCRYLAFPGHFNQVVIHLFPLDSCGLLCAICTSWDCQLTETELTQAMIVMILMATK